jgi:hypothetical protein
MRNSDVNSTFTYLLSSPSSSHSSGMLGAVGGARNGKGGLAGLQQDQSTDVHPAASRRTNRSFIVNESAMNPIVSLESFVSSPNGSAARQAHFRSVLEATNQTIWRPICCQALAILFGWIYLIIPSANYWIKVFVRNQWFSLLVVVGFVELEDTCMPDASINVYIWTYVLGFLIPPFIRVMAWVYNAEDNYYVNTFIPAAPCVVVWTLYCYDALQRRNNSSRSSEISELHDTFLAVDKPEQVASGAIVLQQLSHQLEELRNGSSTSDPRPTDPSSVSRTNSECPSPSLDADDGNNVRILKYDGFFRFLPRFLFHNKSLNPRTCGPDRLVIWAYASGFVFMWVIIWEFVMNFTLVFRQHVNDSKALELLFVVFVACNNILRMAIKRIGLYNDLYKQGTTSMFFAAETLSLLFYYAFYRVLFESVSSWEVFFTLQALHLSLEWLCYPFRASIYFANMCSYLRYNGGMLGRFIADLFGSQYVSNEDWKRFIALDFGIRVTVVISSGISISLYLLSISNAYWVQNGLKQDAVNVRSTIMYIYLAVVMELVNAFVINYLFFATQGVSVYNMLLNAYGDDRFAFLTTVIAAVMFLNPVYAFANGTR